MGSLTSWHSMDLILIVLVTKRGAKAVKHAALGKGSGT